MVGLDTAGLGGSIRFRLSTMWPSVVAVVSRTDDDVDGQCSNDSLLLSCRGRLGSTSSTRQLVHVHCIGVPSAIVKHEKVGTARNKYTWLFRYVRAYIQISDITEAL